MKTPEELRSEEKKREEIQKKDFFELAEKMISESMGKSDITSEGGVIKVYDEHVVNRKLFKESCINVLKENGWRVVNVNDNQTDSPLVDNHEFTIKVSK